ncbi:MAG: hypothetical protein HQL56_01215 [Magnetococcales bacterium]|nr:hypothetical protein [Magnetococcales bacterium]
MENTTEATKTTTKFTLWGDNGGGLFLFVDGYAYDMTPKDAGEAIAALESGETDAGWDGRIGKKESKKLRKQFRDWEWERNGGALMVYRGGEWKHPKWGCSASEAYAAYLAATGKTDPEDE